MTDTFSKQVWQKLSKLDCTDKVKKKGEMSYLSWANAWQSLMDVYPDSSFTPPEIVTLPNSTVEVHVSVTVSDGEHELTRFMSLPVMNYRNVAIVDPDSRDVSDAKMRCLVKCIALFGLGLFLYRGEDAPVPREVALVTEDQIVALNDFMDADYMTPKRMAWVKKNLKKMTQAQAMTIINDCKKAG